MRLGSDKSATGEVAMDSRRRSLKAKSVELLGGIVSSKNKKEFNRRKLSSTLQRLFEGSSAVTFCIDNLSCLKPQIISINTYVQDYLIHITLPRN